MKNRFPAVLVAFAMLLGSLPATASSCVNPMQVDITVEQPYVGRTVSETYDKIEISLNGGDPFAYAESPDDTYGDGTQFTVEWQSGWDSGEEEAMAPDDVFTARDSSGEYQMHYCAIISFAVPESYTAVDYVNHGLGEITQLNKSKGKKSADGKWRVFEASVSFRPDDESFAIAELNVDNLTLPTYGESVWETGEKVSCSLLLSGTSEIELTHFEYDDVAKPRYQPEVYEEGTRCLLFYDNRNISVGSTAVDYTTVEYSDWNVQQPEWADVFSADDLPPGDNESPEYEVEIYYATPVAYRMTYVTPNIGKVMSEEIFAETDEWLIHRVLIEIDGHVAEQGEAELDVPTPAYGWTFAEENELITFTLNGKKLSYRSYDQSDDWWNHLVSGDTFWAVWVRPEEEEAEDPEYALHYYAKVGWDYDTAEEFEEGEGDYWLLIYYVPPIEEDSVDVAVTSDGKELLSTDTNFVVSNSFFAANRDACIFCTKVHFAGDLKTQCKEHVWGEWETTAEVACLYEGEETRTCSVCGAKETQVIPALGHVYGDWEVETPATCTEEGEEISYCVNDCGIYQTRSIPATGHSYGEWVTTKNATCTTTGEQTRTCSACGAKETQAIAATGHNYGEWFTQTQPTCTEAGVQVRICSGCGATKTQSIPATGHSFGNWTPTGDGSGHERICSACGARETGTHQWAIDYDEIYHRNYCTICGISNKEKHNFEKSDDPAKQKQGYDYFKCTGCDYEYYSKIIY